MMADGSLLEFRDLMHSATFDYLRLQRVWTTFKAAIVGESGLKALQSFSQAYVHRKEFDNEVRFGYLGYEWCVTFQHDLECGMLEYGLILPVEGREARQTRVSQRTFSRSGNIGADGGICDEGSALFVHLGFLANDAPDFLRNQKHLGESSPPVA